MSSTHCQLLEQVYYLISQIRDPQFQCTLCSLNVVSPSCISFDPSHGVITVSLKPTTPKCHMMQQIGLSVHCKLSEELSDFGKYKLRVCCKEGDHEQYKEVNKLMNDKERVAAALENPQISKFIHQLTSYEI